MSNGLLIYGATGYTGRLILREALARGLRPVLAGRSQAKLAELSRQHRLEYRVAGVEDPERLRAILGGSRVVLNVAGPFRMTARPLAWACIERGVHYLDITGEIFSMQELIGLDAPAIAKGCMLLPGAGFDVVPSDCMAAWASARLPGAESLSIALSGLTEMSRGSAATISDQLSQPVLVRRAGSLVEVTPGELTAEFDFGAGLRRASAVSWADVATAHRTTGIPNITVYFEETAAVAVALGLKRYGRLFWDMPLAKYWREVALRLLPDGPPAAHRARSRATIVVRVADGRGKQIEARLETPEVYSFTAMASVDIAERVLAGDFVAGLQTPALAYGAEYALSLPGVAFSKLG